MADAATSDNPNPADAERLIQHLRRSRDELDHIVRALSHDMTANFFVLDKSFHRLKVSLDTANRGELQTMALHVEACLRESRRFLDDLALLARTGTVPMEPAAVQMAEVVDEVLLEQQVVLADRGAKVDVHRPMCAVWCNRQRLKQVVTNLVRNAAKHGCDTAEPRITISADTDNQTSCDASPLIALRVHDNGRGIEPRHHEEIFLPGRRLSITSEEGIGMGLAIVRKIAEHYGGSAVVDPSCREGTAIVVRLAAPPQLVSRPDAGQISPESTDIRRIEHNSPHEDERLHRHKAGKTRRPAVRRR